jgi:hypothetical protein
LVSLRDAKWVQDTSRGFLWLGGILQRKKPTGVLHLGGGKGASFWEQGSFHSVLRFEDCSVQFSWCYSGLCIQFLGTSWIIYLFSLLLWVYYASLELERRKAITRWATCFILLALHFSDATPESIIF